MEGLELQPGVIQDFSDAQWQSLIKYEGRAQGAGEKSLKELDFSYVDDGSLYLDQLSGSGPEGMGLTSVLVSLFPCCVCFGQRLGQDYRG